MTKWINYPGAPTTDAELANKIERDPYDLLWLTDESAKQIIAALRRGPQPIHRECEQCGMFVACWSDEQIEAIKRDAAVFRAKIKPAIDAVTGKPQERSPSSDKVLVPRRLSAETIVQISNKVGIGAAAIIDAHNLMLAAAEAEGLPKLPLP